MKIIVCLKQISYTYARTGQDPGKLFIAPEDGIYRINPYDEVCLEMALRIRDIDSSTKISILTLGPVIAETELRKCLAMGADDIYRIDTEDEPYTRLKPELLAKAVKNIGADLILCGKESMDRQSGRTGAYLAHALGMPFVSAILDLKVNGKKAEAQRSAARGAREVIECSLPAVFSVDMGTCEPRLPAYIAKKKAESYQIQKITFVKEKTGSTASRPEIFQPRPRPKKVPAPDNSLSAFYRVEQLLAGSHVEKKGLLLRGDPESQAEGIMTFLEEHVFLKSG